MRQPLFLTLLLCVSAGAANAGSPCEAARRARDELRVQQVHRDEQFVAKRTALQARIAAAGESPRAVQARAELQAAETGFARALAQFEQKDASLEAKVRVCLDEATREDVICTRTVCP